MILERAFIGIILSVLSRYLSMLRQNYKVIPLFLKFSCMMLIVIESYHTLFLGCNSSICDKIIRSYTKTQVMLRGLCLFYNFVAPSSKVALLSL